MNEKISLEKIKANKAVLITVLKYLFALLLTFGAFSKTGNICYLTASLLELLVIFAISNLLMKKRVLGLIVNDILMFLYHAQINVMIFANSYITMVMLTNLDSLEALSGKAGIYITGVLLVIIFSFLPIQRFEFKKRSGYYLLSIALCLELAFTIFFGNTYSPIYGYFNLGIQHYESVKLNRAIQAAVSSAANKSTVETDTSDTTTNDILNATEENAVDTGADDASSANTSYATASDSIQMLTDSEIITDNTTAAEAKSDTTRILDTTLSYYSEEITDYIEKDSNLAEQPNIILIFTEGLSQNIISDERNIMPNAAQYQSESLSFANYYNHTFATFRGLIGQLYSGYQLENYDINALVSLQEIFSNQGYNTFFVNTEPHHEEFTAYLENLGFDHIIGDTTYECSGMSNSISDKDAYEILFDTAQTQSKSDEPFFLAIYTFGTHASLDSTNEKFDDGSDAELNKFYDADYQFGKFMKKFINSSFSDNTIIVFTADHASYQDDSFNAAFPDYHRATTSFDEIPLFIYYKGITPESIDVNGRNTLDLAPTLLDYLDISAPNYFLGTSLFAEEESSICETSYSDSSVFYTSKNAQINTLAGTELEEFNTLLQEYYIAKEVAAATSN